MTYPENYYPEEDFIQDEPLSIQDEPQDIKDKEHVQDRAVEIPADEINTN